VAAGVLGVTASAAGRSTDEDAEASGSTLQLSLLSRLQHHGGVPGVTACHCEMDEDGGGRRRRQRPQPQIIHLRRRCVYAVGRGQTWVEFGPGKGAISFSRRNVFRLKMSNIFNS